VVITNSPRKRYRQSCLLEIALTPLVFDCRTASEDCASTPALMRRVQMEKAPAACPTRAISGVREKLLKLPATETDPAVSVFVDCCVSQERIAASLNFSIFGLRQVKFQRQGRRSKNRIAC